MGTIYFNGKDLCESFNMNVIGRGTYGAPARDIEQVHVPGRNGDLLFDNGGFLNQTVTYPECSILENFPYYGAQLRNFLLSAPGYHELRDTYDPRYYRLAEFRGPFEPDVHTARNNDSAVFDLSFNAKPFRYLREPGDIVLFSNKASFDSAFVVIPASPDGAYTLRFVNTGTRAASVSVRRTKPDDTKETLVSFTLATGTEETAEVAAEKTDIVYVTFPAYSTTGISIYSGEQLIYSLSGDTVQIYNDSFLDAAPLITLAYFKGKISVNGEDLTYGTYGSSTTTIDAEEYTARDASGDAMYNVGGTFPVLRPGLNTIVCTAEQSGSGTVVKCRPRLRAL